MRTPTSFPRAGGSRSDRRVKSRLAELDGLLEGAAVEERQRRRLARALRADVVRPARRAPASPGPRPELRDRREGPRRRARGSPRRRGCAARRPRRWSRRTGGCGGRARRPAASAPAAGRRGPPPRELLPRRHAGVDRARGVGVRVVAVPGQQRVEHGRGVAGRPGGGLLRGGPAAAGAAARSSRPRGRSRARRRRQLGAPRRAATWRSSHATRCRCPARRSSAGRVAVASSPPTAGCSSSTASPGAG